MAEEQESSILDDVKAAADELAGIEKPETPAAEPVEAPKAPETAEAKADRERDEQGRFKPADKPRETLKLKEKPQASSSGQAAGSVVPTAEPPPAAPLPAPSSWNGAGKVKWELLPQPVKEQIAQDYQKLEQDRAELSPVRDILDANKQFLVNEAGSLPAAMAQLVQFAKLSVDNPVALVQHIMRAKGIPIAALTGGQAQPSAQQQPDLASMLRQLVQSELQPIRQTFEQQETQQLESIISSFASNPAHPFFNDVRQFMGVLLETGQAKSMDEAYEMAVRANPNTYAQIQTLEREKQEQAKAAEAQKARAAQRARVTGSPLSGTPVPRGGDSTSSVLDDVRAAAQELSGA